MSTRELGVMGNCTIASLIDRHGRHDIVEGGSTRGEAEIVMTAAQMFWDERLLRHDDMELRRELCMGGNEVHNVHLPCTPWYIDRLASVGRRDEALELFNDVLGWRNHVGLPSEGIGPKTGELWGNFPQTYSQVGLILSAMRLSRTWEEGLWHVS